MADITPGQVAYEAWRNTPGARSLTYLLQLPEWDSLSTERQAAFESAAEAARELGRKQGIEEAAARADYYAQNPPLAGRRCTPEMELLAVDIRGGREVKKCDCEQCYRMSPKPAEIGEGGPSESFRREWWRTRPAFIGCEDSDCSHLKAFKEAPHD